MAVITCLIGGLLQSFLGWLRKITKVCRQTFVSLVIFMLPGVECSVSPVSLIVSSNVVL